MRAGGDELGGADGQVVVLTEAVHVMVLCGDEGDEEIGTRTPPQPGLMMLCVLLVMLQAAQ